MAVTSSCVVLTLNSGSSSFKFAVYEIGDNTERRLASGSIAHGAPSSTRAVGTDAGGPHTQQAAPANDPVDPLDQILRELARHGLLDHLAVAGHRLVHGGAQYTAPVRITPAVRADLEMLIPLAPGHLPDELRAVDMLAQRLPNLPQVACFDTAFHRSLPRVARLFGLPRHCADEGVMRYGFHGLSYEYIVQTLRHDGTLRRRVVIAHLGNGASLAAVYDGRSLDTTMGLTPTGGVVMGTRSGDLDPGVLLYLMRERHLSAAEVSDLVTRAGGLLGLSGVTADVHQLLQLAPRDPRAAEAIDVFCYQVKKAVGALAAALGGLDALVFTGGIGERAAPIRAAVCDGLSWLGVQLDHERNPAHAAVISPTGAPVTVHVIPTNEELMIARHVRATLREQSAPSEPR